MTSKLILPVSLIAIAEFFAYCGNLTACAFFHGLNILVSCYLTTKEKEFASLILPSTFRLVNLGMPVLFYNKVYWIATVYLPMYPALYYAIKSLELEDIFNFNKIKLTQLLISVACGTIIGFIGKLFFSKFNFSPALAAAIVMLVFVSFCEETMYRGIIQECFEKKYGVLGLLLSIFINTIMAPKSLVFITLLIATMAGIIYSNTKNIYLLILYHWIICMVWLY